MPTMQLYFKMLNGSPITIDCDDTDTVETLKEKMKDKTHVPIEMQHVSFEGEELKNDQILGIKVATHSTLDFSVDRAYVAAELPSKEKRLTSKKILFHNHSKHEIGFNVPYAKMRNKNDCWNSATKMVGMFSGHSVELYDQDSSSHLGSIGTSQKEMNDIASKRGFSLSGPITDLDLTTIEDIYNHLVIMGPFGLPTNYFGFGHVVVILGVRDGKILFNDPQPDWRKDFFKEGEDYYKLDSKYAFEKARDKFANLIIPISAYLKMDINEIRKILKVPEDLPLRCAPLKNIYEFVSQHIDALEKVHPHFEVDFEEFRQQVMPEACMFYSPFAGKEINLMLAPELPSETTITIRMGKGEDFRCNIDSDTTILDLKKMISAKKGILPKDQDIFVSRLGRVEDSAQVKMYVDRDSRYQFYFKNKANRAHSTYEARPAQVPLQADDVPVVQQEIKEDGNRMPSQATLLAEQGFLKKKQQKIDKGAQGKESDHLADGEEPRKPSGNCSIM